MNNEYRKYMEYFELFKLCFSEIKITGEIFTELSEIGSGDVIAHKENGVLTGFALTVRDNIRLLCVHPEHRGRGIGSMLLSRAEEHIISQGFDHITIGGASSQLFIGAAEDSRGFFEKHGYELYGPIAEMGGDITGFSASDYDIPVPENISFGYFDGDRDTLLRVVAAVEEDWTQYFSEGDIFCAFSGSEIASFCILDKSIDCIISDGKSTVGSIGCVGTVPRFRRQGIGLKMVALAAEELKNLGCEKCFIHYTHVYNWYARLGFENFLFVYMGGKTVNS